MARARLITASLGSSRKFHALHGTSNPEFAQLLFVLLVPNSDDFGRMKGDAFTVKHRIFPTSPRSEDEFETALDELHVVGLIARYRVDADIFIQISHFEEHQAGLHRRTSSKFPELPGTSGNFPLNRTEENRRETKRTEEKGNEENRREDPFLGQPATLKDPGPTAVRSLSDLPKMTEKERERADRSLIRENNNELTIKERQAAYAELRQKIGPARVRP